MALRTLDSVLNDAVDAAVANADGGTVEFYTGTRPANVGDATGETLLASVSLQATAFNAASGGSADAAGTPITTTGDADGEIGWARVADSGGNPIWDDDDVGTSGNNIEVNTTTVSTGVDFELTSYTFSAADEV